MSDSSLFPWLSEKAITKLTTRHGGAVYDDIDGFIDATSGLIDAGVTILAGTDVSAGTTSWRPETLPVSGGVAWKSTERLRMGNRYGRQRYEISI